MNLDNEENCEYDMTNLILPSFHFLASTFIINFILIESTLQKRGWNVTCPWEYKRLRGESVD